jgi:NTP pyrophosphatase (non-canonical NTP hydrolase)
MTARPILMTGDMVRAILAEEAGEVVKASLDMTYDGGSVEDVRTELAQTGAMCIRMLVNLHNNEVKP